METLWLLTKKNLKLLIRSKSSALIVFLAPLLIILILGLSYNTSSQYGLNIGIYSESFTEDVNSLMETLQEQEFKIIKYENSIEECVEDIKLGYVHACVDTPSILQVESNTPKEVTFYLDPSKINLVWMIQETLKSKFDLQSSQISETLATDMLDRIFDAKTKINENVGQLTTISEKSSSASTLTESAKTTIGTTDLALPTTSYNLNADDDFKGNFTSSLSSSLSSINEAIDTIDDSDLNSSDKTVIRSELNDAKKKLRKSQDLINGTSTNSLGLITQLVDQLSLDLDSTKAKLTTASTTFSTTTADLTNIATTLSESIASVENIKTTLNEIHTNLEEQKVTEAGILVSPLITKIENVGKGETYLSYTFPALIILVIMFSSLLLGTTLVMMEKHSPAFHRNYFIPIKKHTFIISIYLTNLILVLIQIFVILLVALFFISNIASLLFSLTLVLFISASVFTFLGMAIGYIFESEETGVLASISLGSLLMFVSGVILPIESISPMLRGLTYFNPFVIAEKLVKELLVFNSSLSSIWIDLFMLIGYALILFLIILILESILHKKIFEKISKMRHHTHRHKEKVKKNDF